MRATRAAALLLCGVMCLAAPGAIASGPSEGGVTSDNVAYVKFVPFEVATATGARLVGDHLYVTSSKNFSIYDVSKPLNPELLSTTPFGFEFENEDVSVTPDGKTLVFSEQLPLSRLHVWDVEDKTNPVEVATLAGAGQHTMSCIALCRYLYGSDGLIVDLRKPSKPKVVGDWSKGRNVITGNGHDVTEVARTLALVSSQPIQLLDTSNPRKPRLVASGMNQDGRFVHSIDWARSADDRFVLAAGETNFQPRCNDRNGAFMTWDASKWRSDRAFTMLDEYRAANGTYLDGNAAVNGVGCSSHWFEHHKSFNNGGLVAASFFEHGTRFLDIKPSGKITEGGYFMPWGGSTFASYWVTKRLVYAVDFTRGIDIIRYKGKF